MKCKQLLPLILLFAVLASCNRGSSNKELVDQMPAGNSTDQASPAKKDNKQEPIPISTTVTDSTGMPVISVTQPDWDKKIVKTATLKFEVKDFKGYNQKIHQTVKQYGAYISQEEQSLNSGVAQTVMSIKVPVAQFETMMNQLSDDADVKVEERKISTEDVTGEVADTKARLETKKQMRLKYLEFLKSAKNTEETIQVQNEINSIQEEIESAAGRTQSLSHEAAYSTIELTFSLPAADAGPAGESPSFFSKIRSAFMTGANWISGLFIGLVSVWPLLLTGWLIWVGIKKLRQSQKNVKAM
jgi:hypothetical protein